MYTKTFLLIGTAITGMLIRQSTASAAPSSSILPEPDANSNHWASFCDDDACQTNCGTWVDLTNSGCLQGESSRKSFKIKTDGYDFSVALISTPNNECSCQSECDAYYETGCFQLNATADSSSYRFVNFHVDDSDNPCDGTNTNC